MSTQTELSKKIQIIYHAGTFGNLLRWLLDRFSPDCQFKNIDNPWDQNHRVQDESYEYNQKFIRGHQIKRIDNFLDPLADKIVINFYLDDLLFAERCAFYRVPGCETEDGRYKNIISNTDIKLLSLFKINKNTSYKIVAKEIYKIQLHDHENHKWWNGMMRFMKNNTHYQFSIYALWNKEDFIKELESISNKFSLNLNINENIISNITEKISKMYPISTRNRAKNVLRAIKENVNIECDELDILEQAFIEVILEKQHDSVIFPYGTSWFKNTNQINEFLNTYPSYLKHMNPRLPWYNNIKNPFYWKELTDVQKPYTIKEIVEATKNIAPELWKK